MNQSAPRHSTKGLGWPVFLAGFIPGLLHFRLGQATRGAIALASCAVLFFAGFAFLGDRLFWWALVAPDEKSTWLAWLAHYLPLLNLPEMFNLPCTAIGTIATWDITFTGQRAWRLPRDFEHVAGWLTAASGMLAAFWAAEAQWQLTWRRDGAGAPCRPIVNPALAAGLSWLVPGLGHVRAGQKDKGLLMGGAVLLVFALGLLFSQGHGCDRSVASVWWMGQNLCGLGTLFSALVTAPMQMLGPDGFPPLYDVGLVLCTVAGLMNLVVMVDAYTVAERSAFAAAAPPAGGAA